MCLLKRVSLGRVRAKNGRKLFQRFTCVYYTYCTVHSRVLLRLCRPTANTVQWIDKLIYDVTEETLIVLFKSKVPVFRARGVHIPINIMYVYRLYRGGGSFKQTCAACRVYTTLYYYSTQ